VEREVLAKGDEISNQRKPILGPGSLALYPNGGGATEGTRGGGGDWVLLLHSKVAQLGDLG